MSRSRMSQKQKSLALAAQQDPRHRFTNLYSLMHWDYWIRCAAEAVLSRPGSSVAGIDRPTRDTFKKNYEQEIQMLVESLKKKTYHPQPVRRACLQMVNGKKSPLGIPVLRDRIVQEGLRAILDPIYESDFQPSSFGFRKGRCAMDAITVMMSLAGPTQRYYYVIQGSIHSSFDTVHRRMLLSLLKQRIADRDILDLLWKFIRTGLMEESPFASTETGSLQRGVLPPLLANVYLNELDRWAEAKWALSPREKARRRQARQGNYQLIRYADAFVILSNDGIAGVQQTRQELLRFLSTQLHMELSEENLLLTHINDGFDFLGFHIRRHKPEGCWVVHLRPAEASKARVKKRLNDLTSRSWTWMEEYQRLTTLNAIVKGWAYYYRHTSRLADIEEIARHMWLRYLAWLLRKHKGSKKHDLIATRARVIHNRTRWTARKREGTKVLEAYQWLPTARELLRGRYFRKGTDGFPHPYLEEEAVGQDYPLGEVGPDGTVYTATIEVMGKRASRRDSLEHAG